MMQQNSKYLGKQAKDIVTGHTGTITGHVSYLTGCDQLLIVPPSEGNKASDGHWYDINRVAIDEKKPALKLNTDVHAGPDFAAPVK